MKPVFKILILLSALIQFSSCTEDKSELLINEETYKDVFLELIIANHLDTILLANTTHEELIDQIYDHYDVTPEQFRYTHDYFEQDIQKQANRMDQILIMLRMERERVDSLEHEYNRQNQEAVE